VRLPLFSIFPPTALNGPLVHCAAGVYQDELNLDNPLGMGGAIAETFGALLHRIWSSDSPSSSYSPREFKMQLQRFAPQFSGYQQHDSQELVAFLLDGLHEDLNRVIKKPYVEKPDWEGGSDKDLVLLAQKSWEGYMKRNDSVIVDLFQGQYQSTLVCPECQKVVSQFTSMITSPTVCLIRCQLHSIPSCTSRCRCQCRKSGGTPCTIFLGILLNHT
jgi:ubiquitin C-terminal hydrolase